MALRARKASMAFQKWAPGPGGGGGAAITLYNGLYGETLFKRGTFFMLQVYERVGISRVKVYERVGKSVI